MLKTRHSTRSRSSTLERWCKVLILVGWVLFWLAGVGGERVPLAALLMGPAVILAGIILMMREARRQNATQHKSPESRAPESANAVVLDSSCGPVSSAASTKHA